MFLSRTVRCLFSRLEKNHLTFATAESLTGGMIGSAITAVSGASEFYVGGIISYSVGAKERLLGVDPSIIASCGVVSRETAEAMARGTLSATGADVAVAVTGVAGPGGGTKAIPVGTVWMASACKKNGAEVSVMSECHRIGGGRPSVRRKTVLRALSLVCTHLDRC
jgi:PncC family amidohydrolase